MAIARCERHPFERDTKEPYKAYALPVGFPETAAICGRVGCENPARIWLSPDEVKLHNAGQRVFGSGINLTHLYQGRIDFLFYLIRDLGYVNKIYRGLTGGTEKLWVAAVERFAIGGACQLLHTMDHVIATRGCRLYLPARKEGIIPGASNLRLARSVGDRLARQAILSGLEFEAGTPQGDLLVDEVVESASEMDAAVEARVDALTSSGLVNAAANRRAMRVAAEPLDVFRQYMATYCREQAYCHLSPALVRNLEQNWNAHERRV